MASRRSIVRWLGVAATLVSFALSTLAQQAPELVFDPTWPKALPNNWKLGGITGLALDRDENIWLYNRPNDLTNIELHAELDPPLALCCVRAPSMIHLDKAGRVIGSFDAPQGHGMDVDSDGVVWTVLSSGHLASFDRRKCKGPLNGPTAMGQHCVEGWSLYPLPGPNYKGATESGSADTAYYNFVDRFDMLGLGKNASLATGNGSEALLALVDGKFLTLRVPYPMGFYAKGIDGRIDDPRGGWKGKGIWTTYATRAPFHAEGGKGTTSKLVKFQVRGNPLEK